MVIRRDLFGNCRKDAPFMCDWTYSRDNMLHTTPPIMSIYMTGLNIEYMMAQGGITHYEDIGIKKAAMFYEYIDSTNGFYISNAPEKYRSRMNIPFTIRGSEEESQLFWKTAAKSGFCELMGHASTGGCRVSFYNVHDLNSARALIQFMKDYLAQATR